MKKTKYCLSAAAVILTIFASMASKPTANRAYFVDKWFEYVGSTETASDYNLRTNYVLLSSSLGCTSGAMVCQVLAPPTVVNGQLPILPVGFGTAVATYNSNGKRAVNPTEIDGITVDFFA